MTKLEITAIRSLPTAFVRDGTHVAIVSGWVVAIHPRLLPIIFRKGVWRPLKLTPIAMTVSGSRGMSGH